MRRTAAWAVLLGVLLLGACFRRGPEPPPIEARNPHGNYIVPGTLGDVVYRSVDGAELALDAYVQKGEGVRPLVIVVHGGRWISGSRVSRVGQFLEMLTRAGFHWVSIDYRLAPGHPFPAPLDDLRAALAWVRAHAGALRTDPDRIAILGEDAGAHLALLLAAERPEGLAAVVSVGGIFDLRPRESERGLGKGVEALLGVDPSSSAADARLAEASPLDHVTGGMAPVLLVHGEADNAVPLSRALAYRDALEQAGVAARLLPVRGAIHAPENWHPAHWGYKEEVVEWLAGRLDHADARFDPHEDEHLTKDLSFRTLEGADGGRGELRLDAWVPEGEGPFPGVILAHGGGWEAGDKVTYLTPILEPLARAGFAWFSVDYRLTPEARHPQQLDDLRRAIRWVRRHAARFRVDPDRLALLGESASGQMAAQLASEPCEGLPDAPDPVDREPCDVAAVVSFYGVYDFGPMVKDAGTRSLLVRLFGHTRYDEEGRGLLKRYSPQYHAHADMPPMLLLNGTDEFLWEQGVAYAEKLKEVGVEHELYRLEGAGHGMESWEGRPEWAGYRTKVVDWLRERLGS